MYQVYLFGFKLLSACSDREIAGHFLTLLTLAIQTYLTLKERTVKHCVSIKKIVKLIRCDETLEFPIKDQIV